MSSFCSMDDASAGDLGHFMLQPLIYCLRW